MGTFSYFNLHLYHSLSSLLLRLLIGQELDVRWMPFDSLDESALDQVIDQPVARETWTLRLVQDLTGYPL